MGSNVVDWGLRRAKVIDEQPTSTCAHRYTYPIMVKVGGGKGGLGLDAHNLLLGLGVAAEELLVQADREGQGVIDRAEGDAHRWTEVGRETEQVLVGVAIPKCNHSALATRPKQGGLRYNYP